MATEVAFSGEIHPAADAWPMLSEEDLRSLAESIKANGLRHPIVLDSKGRVLDGRNRLAACRIAGVEPRFIVTDEDASAVVLSENNDRRHLTTGQRVMSTALTLVRDGKRENGRWKYGSARNSASGISGWAQRIAEAGTILDHAPDLVPKVVDGTEQLKIALQKAQENRETAKRIAEIGPDLAALVEAEVITLAEAERRADVIKRLKDIPPDIAKQVRDGRIDIDEAEATVEERRVRFEASVERMRFMLRDLGRLAGHPIERGMAEALGERHTAVLQLLLDALGEEDYGFLED